jgi:hypothetical protein
MLLDQSAFTQENAVFVINRFDSRDFIIQMLDASLML